MMKTFSLTRRLLRILSLLLVLVATHAWAVQQIKQPPMPGSKDTCPVCGMFVAKYPEWIAHVTYQSGHTDFFDGAKDLFKYLLHMKKWAPNHDPSTIQQIGVTEYYGLKRIDARGAWYVIGSDVLGPMGNELIPLASAEDANAFLTDHKGMAILRFEDIDSKILHMLDTGQFE